MTDKKLTDSEIIKALECCKYEYDTKCELCCYNFYSRTGCRSELRRNALDLITRQQAEIERLKDEYEEAKKRNQDLVYALQTYKSEAVKEFAEQIFELFPTDKSVTYISRVTIKHILKEMVGENNG